MRNAIFFIVGAMIGMVVCFFVLYAIGFVFEYFDIRFYESESDPQRNFNVFIIISAVFSILIGYFFTKKIARQRHQSGR
jgi:hypothetical protein